MYMQVCVYAYIHIHIFVHSLSLLKWRNLAGKGRKGTNLLGKRLIPAPLSPDLSAAVSFLQSEPDCHSFQSHLASPGTISKQSRHEHSRDHKKRNRINITFSSRIHDSPKFLHDSYQLCSRNCNKRSIYCSLSEELIPFKAAPKAMI